MWARMMTGVRHIKTGRVYLALKAHLLPEFRFLVVHSEEKDGLGIVSAWMFGSR